MSSTPIALCARLIQALDACLFPKELDITDHEPIPIERTQLIEMALNTYEPGSQNLTEISQLDHNILKVDSEMGQDADVQRHLNDLRKSISELKRARKVKSTEAEKAALESASTANLHLRGVITEKMRK